VLVGLKIIIIITRISHSSALLLLFRLQLGLGLRTTVRRAKLKIIYKMTNGQGPYKIYKKINKLVSTAKLTRNQATAQVQTQFLYGTPVPIIACVRPVGIQLVPPTEAAMNK